MSKLRFTDGETFDISGDLRTEERKDGWFVLGEGRLVPVKSKIAGEKEIKRIQLLNEEMSDKPGRKMYDNGDFDEYD